nr:immunoglobulin light chain junction region [Macaca mulatta]MOX11315.1 immunoglobulin light chain junction region [Macaca mulatta]MOX11526.1 immunoglobulin light chain junction region [Macaca mulatta]MOX11621.1 immunoglobulin light chain junction region [Macaca mulatta]MOX12513.1 immunoglobulin light chain junction region [Macaca mulatta]
DYYCGIWYSSAYIF